MAPPDQPRRLIVNADDFGRSASINDAVIRAHRGGILTTASLMVNETQLRGGGAPGQGQSAPRGRPASCVVMRTLRI